MSRKLFMMLLILCFMTLAGTKTHAAVEDEVEGLRQRFREETGCEAVSIVTYDHGTVAYYGDRDGLYQIGSMTKAFTGLAIQKLICEGKLKESDLISEWIPGFEARYDGKVVGITVGQLMAQMSGYGNQEAKYPSAKEGQTLMEWTREISGKSLLTAPGEAYAYSNVNYNLLGAVIEGVTGLSYKEYVEQEVLTPLELGKTYVGEPNGAEVVEGTRLLFRKAVPFHLPVREGSIPAGYFYSNAMDLGRWMEIWMGSTEVPTGFGEVIGGIKAKLGGEGVYYGGWECFEEGCIGHSGGTPNFSSRIVFWEEKNIGVCVLTNLNVAASTDSLCNGILDMMTKGVARKLQSDVWTIFDKIFSALCLLGLCLFLICIRTRKRGILIMVGLGCAVAAVTLAIVNVLIFSAGLVTILFTWAPWSLAVFFGILTAVILTCAVRWHGMREK